VYLYIYIYIYIYMFVRQGSGNWGSSVARIVGRNCQQNYMFQTEVKMWVCNMRERESMCERVCVRENVRERVCARECERESVCERM
jgi:glycerol-3-phosphate dehydrogenase